MAGISWLDKLFAFGLNAVTRVWYAGSELTNRAVVEFTGTGVSVADSPGTGRTVVTVPGVASSFTGTDPESVATFNHRGDSADPARRNHKHNHGDQPGGTLHALAVGGEVGASPGFMSGAQVDDVAAAKVAIDAATSTATADVIAKRGTLGVCSFGALTAPSVTSATATAQFRNSTADGFDVSSTAVSAHHSAAVGCTAGTTITLTAGTNISAAATGSVTVTSGSTTSIVASAALNLTGTVAALKTTTGGIDINSKTGIVNIQKDSATALTLTVDPTGQVKLAPVAGATSVLIQQGQHASAAGVDTTFRAQRGFAGFIGGALVLGGGEGGTGGTNLAGKTQIDLGTVVGGVSQYAEFLASGSAIFTLRRTNSAVADFTCPGTLWIHPTSGAIVGSNDDTVRSYWNQSDATITSTCSAFDITGQFSTDSQDLTPAATLNINWNNGNSVRIGATNTSKVTTNTAVAAPTNPRDGNIIYEVRAISNGTNTLTWNAVFTFPASGNGINQWAAGVPADGKITNHGFKWNGTAYECVYSSVI